MAKNTAAYPQPFDNDYPDVSAYQAGEPVTEPATDPVTEAPTDPATEPDTEAPTESPTDAPTESPTEPGTEPGTNPAPLTDADRLTAYLSCERAILLGHQSYTMDGVGTFTRADLGKVQAAIAQLKQSLANAQALRPTVGGIVTTQAVLG